MQTDADSLCNLRERDSPMIDNRYMMNCVYNQLAIDYNCKPDDFQKDGIVFTEAEKNKNRRPYPFIEPRLEIVTMGCGIIVNASSDILPFVRKRFEGKTREEIFHSPLVYGANLYFLPDTDKMTPLKTTNGYEYEIVENHNIHELYQFEDFGYVLQYDVNSLFPEMLTIIAKHDGNIVGMAGANGDCQTMWGINVDVLPLHRGKGLASKLVNILTLEVLHRGYIPYYFTAPSNILSIRVAMRAGYTPTWLHSYKTRLDNMKDL